MIKILHIGDVHLDSPFSSFDVLEGETAREEQRKVFASAMRYARENKFDMVLISGDLFDTKYVTQATSDLVAESFAALSCSVVISPGNHDPYSEISLYGSDKLPENVYVFSSEEMQVFDFDELGVSVCGYAFVSDTLDRSPLSDFYPAHTDNKLILCAHADSTATISKYAPISAGDIERCGFVYSALGHIHNPPEINTPSGLAVRYSGFLSGRGFDDHGIGGALAVTIDGDAVSVEKVPFTKKQYVSRSLDVSGASDMPQIEDILLGAVDEWGYGEETSLRVELCGTVSMDCAINEDKLSSIGVPCARLKVKNMTLPMPDAEYLATDPSLRGEIYRTLLPALSEGSAEERRLALEALKIAMYAIDGKNLADIVSSN